MNDITTIIKSHCLAIDHGTSHGSGVLMSAITKEYSYVLTARHVLQVDKDDYSKGMCEINEITLDSAFHDSLEIIQFYHHESFDIAVIKIKFISGLSIYPYEEGMPNITDVQLYGCPKSNNVEFFPLKFLGRNGEQQEFSTDESNVQASDIDGYSGGGIFYMENNKAYLFGIETSAKNQTDHVTRVLSIHISNFEQLLVEKKLNNLGSEYLDSFELISEIVFPKAYHKHEISIDKPLFMPIVNKLKMCCKSKHETVGRTPISILKEYKHKLAIKGRNTFELQQKQFWSAFMEFLVIQSIIENDDLEVLSMATDFKDLFKKYRFIYIHEDGSWPEQIEALVKVNTVNLIDSGKVIVLFGDNYESPPKISRDKINRTIQHIGITNTNSVIDNALTRNTAKQYDYINWPSIHTACIFNLKNEIDVVPQIKDKLKIVKQKYANYISINGVVNE